MLITVSAPLNCPASKPYVSKPAGRPVYDKVMQLIELWPNEKLKLMAVGASWYAGYIGVDKVDAIEPLATASGDKIADQGTDLRLLLENISRMLCW